MVWDIVNMTTVIPTQELQTVLKEYASSSNIIIGSGKVTKDSRLNPDIVAGSYACYIIRKSSKSLYKKKMKKDDEYVSINHQ